MVDKFLCISINKKNDRVYDEETFCAVWNTDCNRKMYNVLFCPEYFVANVYNSEPLLNMHMSWKTITVLCKTIDENWYLFFNLCVQHLRYWRIYCCTTVVGGRSRLHLLDLGSCSRAKDGSALSLTSLGVVILALLSGQRHIPHRSPRLLSSLLYNLFANKLLAKTPSFYVK